MDDALWLLLRLRARAWARLRARRLRTLSGALLALVGALVLIPAALAVPLIPRINVAAQSALIRRYGPLGLLGYCVLNVLLSAGERAVYYSPAEVEFLFCGPFRPRDLLVYKAAAAGAVAAVMAAVLTACLQHHTTSAPAAYAGLFLALELLFLVSLAVSLIAGTIGALAFNRQRKVLFVLAAAVLAAALLPLGDDTRNAGTALERVAASPVLRAVCAPLGPFVMAFTAERLWPDLAWHAAVAGLIDLGLFGVVVGLNVRFLEASARASALRYERRRCGGGGAAPAPRWGRVPIPALPWLGGVGPTLWRQLAAATRTSHRLPVVVGLFALPTAVAIATASERGPRARPAIEPAVVLLMSLAVYGPAMVGYDFRPDLVRIDQLKTQPVRPSRLVIGQLLTPVLVLSVVEVFGLVLLGTRIDLPPGAAPAALVLAPPWNLVLVAVENLLYLWYPSRFVAGVSADFEAMGRQFALLTARLLCGGLAGGLAAAAGALVLTLTGGPWPAVAAAGMVLAAAGISLVPLVAQAFEGFDVARERLE